MDFYIHSCTVTVQKWAYVTETVTGIKLCHKCLEKEKLPKAEQRAIFTQTFQVPTMY